MSNINLDAIRWFWYFLDQSLLRIIRISGTQAQADRATLTTTFSILISFSTQVINYYRTPKSVMRLKPVETRRAWIVWTLDYTKIAIVVCQILSFLGSHFRTVFSSDIIWGPVWNVICKKGERILGLLFDIIMQPACQWASWSVRFTTLIKPLYFLRFLCKSSGSQIPSLAHD